MQQQQLFIIFSIKSLLSLIKIEKSSKDGEWLQHWSLRSPLAYYYQFFTFFYEGVVKCLNVHEFGI